jgi:ribosomal protein L5
MLENYYKNVILYDFLLKLRIKNIFNFCKIKNIFININLENNNLEKEKLINILLFLKLLSNQKIKIKNNKINIKIKKNDIIKIKIKLNKKNIYLFLEKLIILIIPEIKKIKKEKNIIKIKLNNIFTFLEFKNEYYKFKNIISMDILIYFNNNNKLKLLLNYFLIQNKQK